MPRLCPWRSSLWGASALVLSVACSHEPTVDVIDDAGHRGVTGRLDTSAGDHESDVPHRGRPRLVVLGDSLTAGLGVAADESYPSRLQARLDAAGYDLEVVNAGVSGDTSAGGLRRLDWSLDDQQGRVGGLVVALGGNDGLRGLSVTQLKDNLSDIISATLGQGVPVLLAGMEAPPNFGNEYTDAFRDVYRDLADEYDILFVPFLLEGVAGVASLNQADGIHPNADGAERVAAHLWPSIDALARQLVMSGDATVSPHK